MDRRNRKGFTLIATGFCVVSLLGMLGLALDLGRVYIAKNETQSFTDTAALAAALTLNGTSFDPARNAVTNNTKNQWNMNTTTYTNSGSTTFITEFAKPLLANKLRPDPATWDANPATATGYTFVRVTATATLPLYVLPVVNLATASNVVSASSLVRTMSVGGQVPLTSFNSGLFPFSPIEHTGATLAANPPFGFVVGQWYTLRYPSGSLSLSDLCPGDAAAGDAAAFLAEANTQASSERGFYQNPQASVANDEIINGEMLHPVTYPGTISMSGGAMTTSADAMDLRVSYDTDSTSTTYAQYQANISGGVRVGNGMRIIGTPVNVGPIPGGGDRAIAGFAGFFLSQSSSSAGYPHSGNAAWCAEYIGTWSKNGQTTGAGDPGTAYVTVLVQ